MKQPMVIIVTLILYILFVSNKVIIIKKHNEKIQVPNKVHEKNSEWPGTRLNKGGTRYFCIDF